MTAFTIHLTDADIANLRTVLEQHKDNVTPMTEESLLAVIVSRELQKRAEKIRNVEEI